jgi:hypothetical protein
VCQRHIGQGLEREQGRVVVSAWPGNELGHHTAPTLSGEQSSLGLTLVALLTSYAKK